MASKGILMFHIYGTKSEGNQVFDLQFIGHDGYESWLFDVGDIDIIEEARRYCKMGYNVKSKNHNASLVKREARNVKRDRYLYDDNAKDSILYKTN